uniref:Sperm associated antigen 7 n=1 Tax=Sinocyclocheilus anshuiensis TaxID=1608454 RepID=A0A671KMN9_9TELE
MADLLEQAARLKNIEEDEKRKKAEFRKKMEKTVSDFIQDSNLQKKRYEPMGKLERSEEWDPRKAEERRRRKEQAALEMEEASRSQKRPASPNSNYRDKYSHLIGIPQRLNTAFVLQVPVANKRDTRSIEEAMNEIRAKKRQKKGAGSGSSV